MAEKNSFILLTKYGSIFAEMSDRQAGILIKAIFHYVATGETMASLNDVEVKTAFKFVKLDLDYNQAKYDALCKSRSEYGKQGAQAKASISKHKPTGQAQASISKHNDNDDDNDNELVDKSTNNITPLPPLKRGEVLTKRFVKPSIDEIKAYCLERKNNVDPQRFFDFYESKGWKVGNSPMKDWKAAVRTWEHSSMASEQKQSERDRWRMPSPKGKYAV